MKKNNPKKSFANRKATKKRLKKIREGASSGIAKDVLEAEMLESLHRKDQSLMISQSIVNNTDPNTLRAWIERSMRRNGQFHVRKGVIYFEDNIKTRRMR